MYDVRFRMQDFMMYVKQDLFINLACVISVNVFQ